MKLLAFVPIPILGAIIGFFLATHLFEGVVFEPPLLGLSLSMVFRFGISMLVAYISAKGYMATGSVGLLMLGSALLLFGFSGITGSAIGLLMAKPNFLVTVNNAGAFLTSLLIVASAVLLSRSHSKESTRGARLGLAISYLGVLFSVALLAMAGLRDLIPPFISPGSGPTVVGRIVLAAATALMCFASLFFARSYLTSKSEILFWSSLAIAFVALSQFAFFFSPIPGSAVSWSGRSATVLGSIYFLFAVITAFRAARAGNQAA